MTNKKFKRRQTTVSREQFTKEFTRAAEHAHFMTFVNALTPLANACDSIGKQVWFGKNN